MIITVNFNTVLYYIQKLLIISAKLTPFFKL